MSANGMIFILWPYGPPVNPNFTGKIFNTAVFTLLYRIIQPYHYHYIISKSRIGRASHPVLFPSFFVTVLHVWWNFSVYFLWTMYYRTKILVVRYNQAFLLHIRSGRLLHFIQWLRPIIYAVTAVPLAYINTCMTRGWSFQSPRCVLWIILINTQAILFMYRMNSNTKIKSCLKIWKT